MQIGTSTSKNVEGYGSIMTEIHEIRDGDQYDVLITLWQDGCMAIGTWPVGQFKTLARAEAAEWEATTDEMLQAWCKSWGFPAWARAGYW